MSVAAKLRVACWTAASLLACGTPTRAEILIATTGFNNSSGINSGLVPPAPYVLGNVGGQGRKEPNWKGPWRGSPMTDVVQNDVVFEGDQALQISATSAPHRAISRATSTHMIVDQYVRVEGGARLVAYTELEATGDSVVNQAAIWQFMPDQTIRVIDGTGDFCDTCVYDVVGNWVGRRKGTTQLCAKKWAIQAAASVADWARTTSGVDRLR